MNDCEALRTVDISSLTTRECTFLLDVLKAVLFGPAALPAAACLTAAESYHEVEQRLRYLEGRGLVGHKSQIKSGHLIPEFFLTDVGRRVVALTEASYQPH